MDEVLPSERIRPSASVILWRRSPHLEVFLAQRSTRTRFFPGYHVFPGGTLDADDGDSGDGAARRRAALRETFEEVGVLAARGGDARAFPRREAREAVSRNEPLKDLMAAHGLEWDLDALVEAGRLLTPPFAPVRYDTSFYTLECPDGETPEVDGEELVAGAWWRPQDALERWETEAFALPPPTLAYLRVLASTRDPAKAAALARGTDERPHHERFRIELHPGVYALPLRAPTLPPATTQNCYLFDSRSVVVVVDPGTPLEAEREVLFHTLDAMLAARPRPVQVLLTHHHADHVGSVPHLKARYGARVFAHEESAARLAQGLVDETLVDGRTLDLGAWRGRPWTLRALHTPGHAPGHLAFVDERWGLQLVGDLVSGVSTILVDPDEGDMADYFASLERLIALDPPLVLAGHGPLLPGKTALAHTLEHRRAREAKVLGALTREPRQEDELLPKVYDDTPQQAWPLAARSLESHLRKLEREGRAQRDAGGAWRLA